MLDKIKDALLTCLIMLFLWSVFYPIVWTNRLRVRYLVWYYTKRGIPFYRTNDKFSVVITRLDK